MSKKVLVTCAPRGTRRRALLGGAALLAGSTLPGWARAAADAAAQAGSAPAANAAGASAGSAAAPGSAASPAAPAVVGTKKIPRLVLAGPFATVSNPLIRIVDAGLLADVAEKVEFVSWRTPDQLRAMALKGEADFLAMPSNMSANL